VKRGLASLALAAAVAAGAVFTRALTFDGALAATLVGAMTFWRMGLRGAAALLAFFVTSSALSRLRAGEKRQVKGSQRDARQVLANGGAATLCAALGLDGGFVGSLATAAADTWATELGMRAGGEPRLITTFRVVERGTSGGVSAAGLAASVGGASVVGLASGDPRVAILAGVAGGLIDSVLGATVQALYRCQVCGALTEHAVHCDVDAVLVKGTRWIDNDAVNGLATVCGAALGVALARYRSRRST
jgi:uncharacterized protein (TIGR00297 family)